MMRMIYLSQFLDNTMMNYNKSSFKIEILLLIVLNLVFSSCAKKHDSNNIIDSNDSTNYNEMVFVKGSTFQMGTNNGDLEEKPVHSVTLSDFYIDKYEVTVACYRSYCIANNKNMPVEPEWGWNDNDPIANVSWYDAVAYANWAGKRLPTEAEWEFAARGGVNSRGYLYSGSNNIGDVAWYIGNANARTHEVGTKQANELGIYDMTGNVWEWCSDWYASYPADAQIDPKGPESGITRILRGGSWDFFDNLSCFSRIRSGPDSKDYQMGFRCARDK